MLSLSIVTGGEKRTSRTKRWMRRGDPNVPEFTTISEIDKKRIRCAKYRDHLVMWASIGEFEFNVGGDHPGSRLARSGKTSNCNSDSNNAGVQARPIAHMEAKGRNDALVDRQRDVDEHLE
jgi:hypothetical protein